MHRSATNQSLGTMVSLVALTPYVILFATFHHFVDAAPRQDCMRLTTFNYHYTPTYVLAEMDSNQGPDITFNFSIRAISDGHIRLSSNADIKRSPVHFEVILGAGGNSFSAIRRKPKISATDYTVHTLGLLSNVEMRPFALVLSGDFLEVFSGDESVSFLGLEDRAIRNMSHIAFGAWANVMVEWSFECRDSETPEPTDPISKLKRALLYQYNRYEPPVLDNGTLLIDISLSFIHVNLQWIDQKLQWDPEDFSNITYLNFEERDIWMPDFVLMDVPKLNTSILGGKLYRLHNNGLVQWSSLSAVETWCEVDSTNWPLEEPLCSVHIGLRSHPEYVQVRLSKSPEEANHNPGSDWNVVSIKSESIINLRDSDEVESQSFKLYVKLKRNQTQILLLCIIPLLVSFIALAGSFTIPAQSKNRFTLLSASSFVLYLVLLGENLMLPVSPHSTPHIMRTTSSLFLMSLFQLTFQCFNYHLTTISSPAPHFVKRVAKHSWMKYVHQAAYESFVSEDNQQEEQTEEERDQLNEINMNKYHWALLSRILDMAAFGSSFVILPILFL